MLHKGNISNIHICPEDVVDCVVGGSPCQDLSVAGLRKGIKHESKGDEETTRSGLFMEQIRIIKEMRDVDKRAGRAGVDIRPRWAVWENVPGALSSGKPKGEDFRIVLEEFAKIADPAVTIPGPPRGGWQPAGCIVGDGFSVAWRIMDARYHGVPQRRRRIALVCDFAADGAPAVLFDEEGMRWDFETSQRAWKGIAPYFAGCAAGSDRAGLGSDRGVEQSKGPGADLYNARLTGEIANTLNANTGLSANHAGPAVCQPIAFKERAGKPGGEKGILCDEDGSCFTLSAHQDQSVCHPTVFHLLQDPISGEVSPCLGASGCCTVGVVLDDQGGQQISVSEDGVSPTLRAQMHGHPPVVCGEANAHSFEPASMKEENWQEREQKNALRSGGSKVGHVVVESAVSGVVYPIEGNGRRASHQGDGWSEEQVGYTLNSVERHGVAYAIDGNVCDRVSAKNGCGYSENVSPTLNTQDRHAVAYDIGEARLRNPSEYDEESPTITARCGSGGNNVPAVVYDTTQITSPKHWSNPKPGDPCHPLAAHQHAPLAVYDARGNGDGETVQTLTGDHAQTVSDYTPIVCSVDQACAERKHYAESSFAGFREGVGTLKAKGGGSETLVIEPASVYWDGGQSLNCVNPVCSEKTWYAEKNHGEYSEGVGTLKASGGSAHGGSETLVCEVYPEQTGALCAGAHPGSYTGQDAFNDMLPVIKQQRKYIVRRLTPLECSRLQGMPDDWCDIPAQSNVTQEDLEHWRPILDEWAKINGKKPKSDAQIVKWLSSPVSESAQYQMYGNGIALPQWVWVCGRIIETYGEYKPTMASLFDGTGSFPLIWNSILGGAYTAWSSEVNPDAIRVSKYRMEERGW